MPARFVNETKCSHSSDQATIQLEAKLPRSNGTLNAVVLLVRFSPLVYRKSFQGRRWYGLTLRTNHLVPQGRSVVIVVEAGLAMPPLAHNDSFDCI